MAPSFTPRPSALKASAKKMAIKELILAGGYLMMFGNFRGYAVIMPSAGHGIPTNIPRALLRG